MEKNMVKSEAKMLHREVKRSMALTDIVCLLEAGERFEILAGNVLQITGEYLDIERVHLIQLSLDGQMVSIVSEWKKTEYASMVDSLQEQPYQKMSFEEIHVFQTDGEKSPFTSLYKKEGIVSYACVPIRVKDEIAFWMNLCTYSEEFHWGSETLQFIQDITRIMQSIVNRKIIHNSVYRSYGVLKEILNNSRNGVVVLDKTSHEILFSNKIVEEQFGSLENGLPGWGEFYSAYLEGDICQTEEYIEYYDITNQRWYEITFADIMWVDGRYVSLATTLDVTEERKYQEKIEFQANNDFLTGLFNRMCCERDLHKYVQEAKQADKAGAVIFIDVDDFKIINDTLGHQYGDMLLQKIAAGLRSIKGLEKSCYRIGGDEFIVIIRPEYWGRLEEILEEISSMFNRAWNLSGTVYHATMSMGVAEFPNKEEDIYALIQNADAAMYQAKKKGKNRYEYYGSLIGRRQENE